MVLKRVDLETTHLTLEELLRVVVPKERILGLHEGQAG